MISFSQAHQLTIQNISSLPNETVALSEALGRVNAAELYAKVDSPSADVSFKDGFAVHSADVTQALLEQPASLRLHGFAAAGEERSLFIEPGTAMRIMSGAALPAGADAVVSEEFSSVQGDRVFLTKDARPGRNVLARGSDVACGQFLLAPGIPLQPAQLGLAASAGLSTIQVHQKPRVAILATGDEVIAPGMPLHDGQLFASNLVTLAAWCSHYGMPVTTRVLPDIAGEIEANLLECIASHDAVLTCGGAWNSERDLVIQILARLGWTEIYHRVRMGPGKAVGFGLLHGKPIFCLPGGPPSNYMAFINLALPGLMQLGGYLHPGLPTMTVHLAEAVRGGDIDWTQFIQGRLEPGDDLPTFRPLSPTGRLQMLAAAQAVLTIPEGIEHISAGAVVQVQVLA